MLLLSVCGADFDSIIKEYEASSAAMARWHEQPPKEIPADYVTERMLSVQARCINNCLLLLWGLEIKAG